MRLIRVMVVAALLAGCSALQYFNPLDDGPSVEANVNAGKTVSQDKSTLSIQEGGDQTADTITNDTAYQAERIEQVSNQMPAWMFLVVLVLAGWAIPSPGECVRGTANLFRREK